MAFTLLGPVSFQGGMDDEGHRTYEVTYLMYTLSNQDGPAAAMQCAGLPLIGATYAYGSGSELDIYAWRRPGCQVRPSSDYKEGDFPLVWYATVTFSTKPRPRNSERPNDSPQIENPLAEPQKVSGSFNKFTRLAKKDRFGYWIVNSAKEPVLGPENEWDEGRHKITVEQNVPDLQRSLVESLIDHLNISPMWGYPARSVKFSEFDWTKHWGKGASYYYTRRLGFEVRVKRLDHPEVYWLTVQRFSAGNTSLIGKFNETMIGATVTFVDKYWKDISTSRTILSLTRLASTSGKLYQAQLSGAVPVSTTLRDTACRVTVPVTTTISGDWDREVVNTATRVLRGEWKLLDGATPGDPRSWQWVTKSGVRSDNPNDFQRAIDTSGNPTTLILGPDGTPFNPTIDAQVEAPYNVPTFSISKYESANLFQLNVPTTF